MRCVNLQGTLRIYDGGFRNSLLFCCKAEKAARKDLFGDDHR
mgnify:CR=1 FL=1